MGVGVGGWGLWVEGDVVRGGEEGRGGEVGRLISFVRCVNSNDYGIRQVSYVSKGIIVDFLRPWIESLDACIFPASYA